MREPEVVEHRIREAFREAGVRGWVHARPVGMPDHAPRTDGGHGDEVGVDADVPVPMASVYKVLLAVAWARLVADGELDARARVTVPAQNRTPGPTGLSVMDDEATLSQRDLVTSMLTVSDNAAADVLLDLVGLERVRAVVEDAGLSSTTVFGGVRHHQRLLLEETGAPGFPEALRLLAERPGQVPSAIYDPALSSTTTARDMTTFLAALWRDELAPAPSGEMVRGLMARQAWRHRLASGFPHDDVEVAGKTGTLLALRHEVGVVTFPGEEPIAVAVLTHALNPAQHLPRADAVIGAVGSLAVRVMRRIRL